MLEENMIQKNGMRQTVRGLRWEGIELGDECGGEIGLKKLGLRGKG
jgi:hypothetical protein